MGILSLFGCSKVKNPPSLERKDTHLAFVLLSEPALPEFQELIQAYNEFSGTNGSLSLVENDEENQKQSENESRVMVVKIKDVGTAFIAVMPTPVPNHEAEDAYQYSLSSFRDNSSVDGHKAHLLVTLMDIDPKDPPVQAMMGFTSLLAAIGKVTPSIGVYCGNAGATHAMDFFLSIASDTEISTRAMLWTGVSRAQEDEERISFLSLGMNQLALPNLYLICPKENAGEAMEMFYDLIAYVIDRGSPIPEGDTVGSTDKKRTRVNYVKSPADNGEVVWRVEL